MPLFGMLLPAEKTPTPEWLLPLAIALLVTWLVVMAVWLARIVWAHRMAGKHIDAVGDRMREVIAATHRYDNDLAKRLYECLAYENAVLGASSGLWRFWCWRIDDFATDLTAFREVYRTPGRDPLPELWPLLCLARRLHPASA